MVPKEIRIYLYNKMRDGYIEFVHILDNYAVVQTGGCFKHFCGYTWFKLDEIPEEWHEYSNINYNLDIHGGLTYSNIIGDYIIYGFDCAHANDENNPKLQDGSYILELCQVMKSEIVSAIPRWCKDKKAEIIKIEREIKRFCGKKG